MPSPQPSSPAEAAAADAEKTTFRVVGQPLPRVDARPKVTGKAQYTADVRLPHMAHAKVLRSELAHARIVSIDTSAALARPGVLAVVTGADLLELQSQRFGHAIKDHLVLAHEKVRYIGEPVAAVVAEDEATAQEALRQIVVEYDELPAVTTIDEALAPGAPLVHEQRYQKGVSPGHVDISAANRPTNVCFEKHFSWGDVDAAFARAAHVVEGEYHYPMNYAYAMEPYVTVADYGDDVLTVYSCAQHLYMVRSEVASIFGLPLNRVRMITPYIGGGFGSKSYTKIEPLTAICSWKVKRPVKLELTVDESMLTTRSDDAHVTMRTAVDADGRLIARRATIHLNTGAYADNSPLVAAKVAIRVPMPYLFEAAEVTSYAVYTNTCPASSYRGFGAIQTSVAGEGQVDELAHALGMDPVAFRLRNLPDPGQRFFPGMRGMTADIKGDLHKLVEAVGWGEPLPPNRGRGIAMSAMDAGAAPVGRSEVRLHGDGSVTVLTGSAELGQGSRTVLGQIAAEEFGVDLDKVRVLQSDTALIPFARSTGADRTTTLEGKTVLLACRDAKEQLRSMAGDLWEADTEDIRFLPDGTGVALEGRPMTWSQIIGKYYDLADMEVVGRGDIRQAGDLAELPPWWEAPMACAEVEIDPTTGTWKLLKLVSLTDAGLAINPNLVRGQVLGAATLALSIALGEELVYSGQQLANGSMLDYRVARFTDRPPEFQSLLIENRDGIGPYGAKGIGDGPMSILIAAIANALRQASGVRLQTVPFSPESVWHALQHVSRERSS